VARFGGVGVGVLLKPCDSSDDDDDSDDTEPTGSLSPMKIGEGNTRWITGGPHYAFAISCLGDRTPNPQDLVGVRSDYESQCYNMSNITV
jgi:hypothetical protein